jgi:hypothetical protein
MLMLYCQLNRDQKVECEVCSLWDNVSKPLYPEVRTVSDHTVGGDHFNDAEGISYHCVKTLEFIMIILRRLHRHDGEVVSSRELSSCIRMLIYSRLSLVVI